MAEQKINQGVCNDKVNIQTSTQLIRSDIKKAVQKLRSLNLNEVKQSYTEEWDRNSPQPCERLKVIQKMMTSNCYSYRWFLKIMYQEVK